MALVRIEGFGHQTGTIDLISAVATAGCPWAWSVLTLAGTLLVPGQVGGKALALGTAGIFGGSKLTPFASATAILGCAVYIPVGGSLLIGFWDAATQDPTIGTMQLSVLLDAARAFNIYRGSPSGTLLLATAGAQFPHDTWFYLELKPLIDASVGTIGVRLRGRPYLSLTGSNTQAGAAARVDSLFFGGGGSALISDVYIADTVTGAGPRPFNDFQGVVSVFTRFPSGPGIAAQFTPLSGANYTQVRETAMDGDASYNYDSGTPSGDKDLFAASSLPARSKPLACMVEGAYRRTDSSSMPSIVNKLLSGALEVAGTPVTVFPTYTYQSDIYPLDPNGGAWSAMSINASQIGYQVFSTPATFPCDAVFFTGTEALWNFPAMLDSPTFSMSLWLYVSLTQWPGATSGPLGGPWRPDNPPGDLGDSFDASLFSQPGNSLSAERLDSQNGIPNFITGATTTNPCVLTLGVTPHNIPVGAYVFPVIDENPTIDAWGFGGTFTNNTFRVLSVSPTTITIDADTGTFPPYAGATIVTTNLLVYNTLTPTFNNAAGSVGQTDSTTTPMSSDVWVNLLISADYNHAVGSRVVNVFYGETQVPITQTTTLGIGAFTLPFGTAATSEEDTWALGGVLGNSEGAASGVVAYMAEAWFAPGQFIDFTDPAARALFHDGSNRPISLGPNGSVPTGAPPAFYLRADTSDPYTTLGLPLRFIDTGSGARGFSRSTDFVNGITSSPLMVVSIWTYGAGDFIPVGRHSSHDIELDFAAGTGFVRLTDVTQTKVFAFHFPINPVPQSPDISNFCMAVDTNHGIGTKLALVYINNIAQTVTVTTDNAANWSVDWSGTSRLDFCESNGFIAEFWLAPDQYFDPVNQFMDSLGAPVNLLSNGSGPSGVPPSIYCSCQGAAAADTFANNLGSGGTLTPGGTFRLVPPGATFLKNRAGGRNLLLNSVWHDFALAPTSPCMVTTCLPFVVYSNRLVVPAYAGDLYTIRRSGDNTTMAFPPTMAGDADSAAINTFIGAGVGNVTVWNDQSGNGFHALEDVLQVAFPETPIWLSAQVNGHPALQFGTYGVPHAGLDSGYGNEGGLTAYGLTFPTASWTVFIVAKHDDYHLASTYPNISEVVSFLGLNAGASDPPGNNFEIRTNPKPYPGGPPTMQTVSAEANDATFSNGNGFDVQATFDPSAGYVVYEFSWSNNPTNNTALDVAKYSGTDYPPIEDNSYGGDFSVSGDMGVGGRSGSSSPVQAWVGWIAEIQIYNCILAPTERATRRSDIASYYGITLP